MVKRTAKRVFEHEGEDDVVVSKEGGDGSDQANAKINI